MVVVDVVCCCLLSIVEYLVVGDIAKLIVVATVVAWVAVVDSLGKRDAVNVLDVP